MFSHIPTIYAFLYLTQTHSTLEILVFCMFLPVLQIKDKHRKYVHFFYGRYIYIFLNFDASKLFQKILQYITTMRSLTLSLHSVRNQLLAQGPMSQFSISFGRSFMLHSSSSTMSPRLLTHFTSRVLCPTPQGTEHCNRQQFASGLYTRSITSYIAHLLIITYSEKQIQKWEIKTSQQF